MTPVTRNAIAAMLFALIRRAAPVRTANHFGA